MKPECCWRCGTVLDPPSRSLTVRKVMAAVAQAYDMPVEALTRRSRHGSLIGSRQVLMYLCVGLTGLSQVKIGRALGRDHSTVAHGRDQVARSSKHDAKIQEVIAILSAARPARKLMAPYPKPKPPKRAPDTLPPEHTLPPPLTEDRARAIGW